MEVETFEVTEIGEDLKPECTEEQLAMIEKLGLEGQQSLLTGNEEVPIMPYQQLSADLMKVLTTVFPTSMKVEEYDRGPIPLRVLQIVAHAREIPQFKEIFVWCHENAADKDPVLVAKGEGYSEYYLLARWGMDALVSFDELTRMAAESMRGAIKSILVKIQSEVRSQMDHIDEIPSIEVIKRGTPTFYWH